MLLIYAILFCRYTSVHNQRVSSEIIKQIMAEYPEHTTDEVKGMLGIWFLIYSCNWTVLYIFV